MYKHSKGVVHRDIKFDNIMIAQDPATKEPLVKLIDFGLSSILIQNKKSFDCAGSIAFMSPEMAGKKGHD